MRKYIYIFILSIIIFSCNDELKTKLEDTYNISAERENDTIQIGDFEILNTKKVDFYYIQNIRINNLKYVIRLNKSIVEKENQKITLLEKNIDNRNRLIELNNKKKDEYLIQIEYDQKRLESSKLSLKNIEHKNALTHQEIVLIKAELNQKKENEYELVKFVFTEKLILKVELTLWS